MNFELKLMLLMEGYGCSPIGVMAWAINHFYVISEETLKELFGDEDIPIDVPLVSRDKGYVAKQKKMILRAVDILAKHPAHITERHILLLLRNLARSLGLAIEDQKLEKLAKHMHKNWMDYALTADL